MLSSSTFVPISYFILQSHPTFFHHIPSCTSRTIFSIFLHILHSWQQLGEATSSCCVSTTFFQQVSLLILIFHLPLSSTRLHLGFKLHPQSVSLPPLHLFSLSWGSPRMVLNGFLVGFSLLLNGFSYKLFEGFEFSHEFFCPTQRMLKWVLISVI